MDAFDTTNEGLADSSRMLAMTDPTMSAAVSMLANLAPLLEALAGWLSWQEKAESRKRYARS